MKFIVIVCVLLVWSGCDSSEPSIEVGESAWAPTTKPFDPTCADCTEVGEVELGHMGAAKIMFDTTTDDPEAQWVRCVNGILDCVEQTSDMPGCVETSGCPSACKAEYGRKRSGAPNPNAFDAKWNAFEIVFTAPTAVCSAEAGLTDVEVVP